MNARQMAQQIKHELELATWPEGTADLIFGTRNVLISAGVPTEDQLPGTFPFALVSIDAGTADVDDPNLLEQSYTILTVQDVANDPMGEGALIGGPQSALGKSANRGVLELSDQVRRVVGNLTGADGASLRVQSTATGTPAVLGRGRHLAIDETTVTGWTTAAPSYAAPVKITTSGPWTWTGGTASVRGHCSGVFDFLHYAIGYVAGSTPAASYHDFDAIATTSTTESATVSTVAGRTYSLVSVHGRSASLIEGSSPPNVSGAYTST